MEWVNYPSSMRALNVQPWVSSLTSCCQSKQPSSSMSLNWTLCFKRLINRHAFFREKWIWIKAWWNGQVHYQMIKKEIEMTLIKPKIKWIMKMTVAPFLTSLDHKRHLSTKASTAIGKQGQERSLSNDLPLYIAWVKWPR